MIPFLRMHLVLPFLQCLGGQAMLPRKRSFGGCILTPLRWLAAMKGLRGSAVDLFALHADRKLEKRLLHDYEALIAEILPNLCEGNYDKAVGLAGLVDQVRGFGPVKARAVAKVQDQQVVLLAEFLRAGSVLEDAA